MKIETALRLKHAVELSSKIKILNPITISFNDHDFNFNHIFDPTFSQNDIYKQLIFDYLYNFFITGLNVNIFAYDSIQRGKSLTMGSEFFSSHDSSIDELGIISTFLVDLFTLIEHEKTIDPKAIYNVKISSIVINGETRFKLVNETKVRNLNEVIQMLQSPFSLDIGCHFVFIIKLEKKILNRKVFQARFNLIDLAYSSVILSDDNNKAKSDISMIQVFLREIYEIDKNEKCGIVEFVKECITPETKTLLVAWIDPVEPCFSTMKFASHFTILDEIENQERRLTEL